LAQELEDLVIVDPAPAYSPAPACSMANSQHGEASTQAES
jgi:hypothetical protein